MAQHIHIHFRDYGTSEGARKAAQSRGHRAGGVATERKYHSGPHATRKEADKHARGLTREKGRRHGVEEENGQFHARPIVWHVNTRGDGGPGSGPHRLLTHGSRGPDEVDIKAGSNTPQPRKKPDPEPFRGYDAVGGLVGGFLESQHPRGKGGKFAKKGEGGGGGVKSAVKKAGSGLAAFGKQIGGEGHEDYEALKKHFSSSGTRKTIAGHLRHVAKGVKPFIETHMKEQKHTVINAGRALKHIFSGNKPTAGEMYALTKFGGMVTMSVMGAFHGDPTGAAGHAIMAVIQEAVQHLAIEHAGESAIGLGRFAHHRLRQRLGGAATATAGDADGDIDYNLLQQFLENLADGIENMQMTR